MLREALFWLGLEVPFCLLFASCVAPSLRSTNEPTGNGISVDVQLYNTRKLQDDLKVLRDKLGQVSVIDQASLVSHLGGIQGAESSQFAMNLQATGLGTPSISTTSLNGTPSIAQTLAGSSTSGTPSTQTTSGQTTNTSTPQVQQTFLSATPAVGTAPATPATSQTVTTMVSNTAGTTSQTVTSIPSTSTTNSNQTVTNTPSNTLQTVTSTPSLTPSVPVLSSVPSLGTPSTPNTSTLDLLGEQMQASYGIIGLRALLTGAESDDYTPKNDAKRHVTLGFPISVTTPKRYQGAAAEVEITVCNPVQVNEDIDPTVQLLLPQEKTYNVASMVSSSASLGAGAVIAGVLNIGANFSWTHQTYYIVKQQDTISRRQPDYPVAFRCADSARAVTFGWQFRPVLGQKIIDPDPRMTYALLAFAPGQEFPGDPLNIQVSLRTCWREFFAKTGLVGNRALESCSTPKILSIPSSYNTLAINRINASDNGNGTLTTTVYGHFQPGTRVGLGEAYLDESIPGFENNGKFLRFTSTAQALSTRGARLLSPDGSITPLEVRGDTDEPSNYLVAKITTGVNGPIPLPELHCRATDAGSSVSCKGANHGSRYDETIEAKGNFEVAASCQRVKANRNSDGSITQPDVTGSSDVSVHCQVAKESSRILVPGKFERGAVLYLDGVAQATTQDPLGLTFPPPANGTTGPFGPSLRLDRALSPGAALTRCTVPYAHAPSAHATMRPFSDTMLEITLPITTCLDVGSHAANGPYVVIMGGRTFGLSDAPFRTSTPEHISFLVSSAFVQGITSLKLKRLFVDEQYESYYDLTPPGVAVSGISLASASSYLATFLLTGTGLRHAHIIYPWTRAIACCDTYTFVEMSSSELVAVKSLILKPDDGTSPITVTLPAGKLTDAEFDDSKLRYSIAFVGKSENSNTYVITGIEGADLYDATLLVPHATKTSNPDMRHLVFEVDTKEASNNKEVIIKTSSGRLITLATPAVPAAPKTDDAAATTKDFKLDEDAKGLAKGATDSYSIKGSNLQLITTIRYMNVPLSFRLAADSKSLTIDQLPTGFTANTGKVPLEIRMTDRSRQVYEVTVK
jgi:hypothetical protein